jgi:DNA/RNA endonuclease G (NUC1)
MANMVPQHKSSNIGIWKTFELYQRNLLQRK